MTAIPCWRGLPPLAGICSFEEAQRTAMTVEQCVAWMKRLHYLLVRLREIFTARITSEPVYELKTAFSLHAYLCAEHATAYRKRIGELREPPLGLEAIPHPALRLLCDEVLCAPTNIELVLGLYEVIVPSLIDSHKQYLATTNPLADAPSVRVARFCLLELEDVAGFGRSAIQCLVDELSRDRLADWLRLLEECLRKADGASGPFEDVGSVSQASPNDALTCSDTPTEMGQLAEQAFEEQKSPHPNPVFVPTRRGLPTRIPAPRDEDTRRGGRELTSRAQYSATPFRYDPEPKRDARFQDSFNAGVNPEAFLYDDRFAPRDKVLMMLYKRLREIDVPEMMASILHQTPGQPWKYYCDMSRQLWDEARHAMLGEVGFIHLGIDWTRIPINFTWSRNLNTQLEPWERHAVLFFIEQGLMPRTGKRYEWEVGQASGIPLAALIQDFDWADEVLHAQIGREWYVKEFRDLNEAMSYGDRCWSQVLSQWRSYRDAGLTRHRNWWPEIYRAACERWGVIPDDAALAFDTSYENTRADLQKISASG